MPWKDVRQATYEEEKFLSKNATSVKTVPMDVRLAHTRPCYEANAAKNCKSTVEKKLTKDQSVLYNSILDEERDRNEEHIKKLGKNTKIVKQKKEIIIGQI